MELLERVNTNLYSRRKIFENEDILRKRETVRERERES